MKKFKHYLRNSEDEKQSNAASSGNASVEMTETARTSRTPVRSGKSTPGNTGSRPVSRSRPGSVYPGHDFRNNNMTEIWDIQASVMISHLHDEQRRRGWYHGHHNEGVSLKKGSGEYTAMPEHLAQDPKSLFSGARALKTRAAMTVRNATLEIISGGLSEFPHGLNLANGLRLQVIPDITFLPRCQVHQFAAIVQDSGMLIVWDDNPPELVKRADMILEQIMDIFRPKELDEAEDEKAPAKHQSVMITTEAVDGDSEMGVPKEHLVEQRRKIVFIQPLQSAFTLLITIAAMGSGWRQLALETMTDHAYMRFVLIVIMPLQFWLALFFMQSVVGCIFQIIGPTSQMNENTKFYSGKSPPRIFRDNEALPHVTIQCPVYKEGLYSVIQPTITSLKAAISTYEMQGGSANIFVNDDGMQLIPEEDAQARRIYYEENNIGWVARPKHNPKPAEGERQFIRAGKFKKASNMNYAMELSARVEEKLAKIRRHERWTVMDELDSYNLALETAKDEDEGRTWAEGNIRIGDYILLIDSDTRVPTDCFLDAVNEMELSPRVAIIQYSSGVMNVTSSFFEKGITFFTNLIYTAIRYAVANGDVAPFVGHNAILRWKAIQDISYEKDGVEMYWSESTVSEDFDMALRLQTQGYLIRLGAYTADGFKEGVSLTVYDELARWEKYAYGCNELIFHPMRYWFVRGPFTPLFKKFIGSNMPLPSKLTIMAYIGTYYAIGSAWLLTLANYFLVGWFNGHLDHYYIDSFKIYFSIVIVFNCLGNVALAILRYRIKEANLGAALLTNFKWIFLLTIFLGGISIHVSQALLSHMFSVDMSWGATAKELEQKSFFEEVGIVIKKFKYTFIFCILCVAMMIVLATPITPPLWQIKFFTAIWPLATIVFSHFFLPIALNPGLMLFTF